MPPFDDTALKPDERWALVQYIQSLRRKDAEVHEILKPADANIVVKRVRKLPAGPTHPAWEKFDNVRVPLNPLWPEPGYEKPFPRIQRFPVRSPQAADRGRTADRGRRTAISTRSGATLASCHE